MANPAAAPSIKLQNVYYERKAGTSRPCYICRAGTTTVLATAGTQDFLYTCDKHLTDPGFVTLIQASSPAPASPSPAEIAKVIEEHKAREARKAEKAKVESADKDKDKEKEKKDTKDASPAPSIPLATSSPATPAGPSHRKFELHRSIFAMRQRELKQREQGVKAREVGKGLPQVPRGQF